MTFAKRVFTLAGLYGLVVMTPMYFAELALKAEGQPLLERPESHYGFVGITLVYQLVFLLIGRDPARYRPLMPLCVLEKLAFGAAVWPLYLLGRTPAVVTIFATVDLVLGALFAVAWLRTRPAAAWRAGDSI
jgi:hypothetical protein